MNFFRKKPPLNQRSQIAVIITFVIAVIFLFIAVFINLSKVSQVKTTTSTAADKAALSLASQLGSMSHYYKDTVLKGETQECSGTWLALLAVAVLTGVVSFFFFPAVVLGSAIAATITATMVGGISDVFNKEMTLYNSLREQTLFQALLSMQTDDVELKNTGMGLFHDEGTGDDYNLSAIPGMLEQKKAGRFLAWYYNRRIPLLIGDEKELKNALDTFTSGFKRVIDIDVGGWDSSKWKINRFSYIIKPGPVEFLADYAITCTSPNCPAWVKDSAKGQLKILDIDATQTDKDPQITGGFLQVKLTSLLERLNTKYSETFCEESGCKIKPSDVSTLTGDMNFFLAKSREVLNMPVSIKSKNITQWFQEFYNSTKHRTATDRRSVDNPEGQAPADFFISNKDAFNTAYSQDVYLRLIRDQIYINNLIASLKSLNNDTIIPDIIKKHGECPWGRGNIVNSSCNTRHEAVCPPCAKPYCGGDDGEDGCCQVCCFNSQKCAWEGIYYTCCQSPPVCSSGDLYGDKPGWCSNHGNHAPCHPECAGCDVQNFNCDDNAKDFQGRLAHDNTSGPTEVEQALQILRALNYDIDNIKKTIEALEDAIQTHLPDDSPLRNEIVYAWKDKPVKDKAQFSHLVRVKIGSYPAKLPYVNESVSWLGLKKCRQLENYSGDFRITTSRYDQDQPTDIGKTDEGGGWQLRRRKKRKGSTGEEFPPVILDNIVTDIRQNGKISTTNEGYVKQLLYWDAITSCSQAHYGAKKSDIYITGTKCEQQETSPL